MRTPQDARELALAFASENAPGDTLLAVMDALTQEYVEGWVYFYQAARFVETRDIRDSLVGNAPVFVPRDGSPVCSISHHRPIVDSVAAFRICGDANAAERAEILLGSWSKGAKVVSAIQVIRSHSSLGLAAAKMVVERCLAGQPIRLPTSSTAAARSLAAELTQLGFDAEVTYGA